PEARFLGVSKLLMQTMEKHLSVLGCNAAVLGRTLNARRFYRKLGYHEVGPLESRFGTLPGTLMAKHIPAA
ncbi:GNAT family N-acetyltransferase, partial [uncultured Phenylobacterium sp.]|uniref:GNAT family N-acetyltransferase n=1 Tax=uncultured Phenylobacterium sp. TaxID=349273 RepID=UPI00345D95DC